jgi:SAM-dependent methyltransferase
MTDFLRRARACVVFAAALLATAAARAQFAEEVPFITSPDNVTLEMLRTAAVGAKDHLIDLGSGDGRIVITAARRFGATGLGVEIVPDLVQQSLRNARAAGVAEKVDFREQDLFQTDLSRATVVTMYLLPDVNLQLRPRLLALQPGTRIVSHDWNMGDWQPDRTTTVDVPDKKVGLEKFSRVHLWIVPAQVQGLWCGARGTAMALTQKYQQVQARFEHPPTVRQVPGRMQGTRLRLDSGEELEFAGDALRGGGAEYRRAPDGRC